MKQIDLDLCKLSNVSGTAIDWSFYTVPQEHLDGRILPYHRSSIISCPRRASQLRLTMGVRSLSLANLMQAAEDSVAAALSMACTTDVVVPASTTSGQDLEILVGAGMMYIRFL